VPLLLPPYSVVEATRPEPLLPYPALAADPTPAAAAPYPSIAVKREGDPTEEAPISISDSIVDVSQVLGLNYPSLCLLRIKSKDKPDFNNCPVSEKFGL
jgi:hypothetical protein